MKMILGSRMHHYIARVGIVLIAIALIVATVSCGDGGGTTYSLTMAVAPAGNGTATDLTNAPPYTAGTAVSIEAVAAAGYHFVSWTAPAGGFANATAAETTFTMPAQDVIVTANFVPVYSLTMAVNPAGSGSAQDLTGASPYAAGTIVNIKAVANPGYRFVSWTAPAGTFGNANAAQTTFTMPAQNVTVTANFVRVYGLTMAVNPVGGGTATDLTGTSPYAAGTVVNIKAVANLGYQFVSWTAPAGTLGNATAATTTFTVPAQNVTVTANFVGSLDHYLSYYASDGTQYIGEDVTLEDRFGAVNATVTYSYTFANPAEKWYNGELSPIEYPDIHCLYYNIACEGAPSEWLVVVENQFGIQELTVSGPNGLNAPAQKLGPIYHDPPVGAWHSISYRCIAFEAVNQIVDLHDEFDDFTGVFVTTPRSFINPASKIHDGNVTEVPNVGDVCWVAYHITVPYIYRHVKAVDQFGEENLDLVGPVVLAVPSLILYYERIS